MTSHTKEEIAKVAAEIWPHACVSVIEYKSGEVDIELSSTSRYVGLTYDQLVKLSEFFNTIHINVTGTHNDGGCDTCDYGSEYGFVITVKPNGDSK